MIINLINMIYMKRTTLLLMAITASLCLSSQTIIQNPRFGYKNTSYLNLVKLELHDTSTVLHFHVNFNPGWWIHLRKGYYIKPVGSDERFFVEGTEGIPFDERYYLPETGKADFKAFFPPLDDSVLKFDFGGEGEMNTPWFIFDIRTGSLDESLIPAEIAGNWFSRESGAWELGLFESKAAYDNRVWNYDDLNLENGKGAIILKNGEEKRVLYLQLKDDDSILAGESLTELRPYVTRGSLSPSAFIKDTVKFELPVFNLDTIIVSGYLKDYSPRAGKVNVEFFVNNIITGGQDNYLADITRDGSFSLEIPVYHPTEVFLRSQFHNGSVFMEPGKDLFIMFDTGNDENPLLTMGESARINNELSGYTVSGSMNQRELQTEILDMSLSDFRVYCDSLKQVELQDYNNYAGQVNLSAKARQVRMMDMKYMYLSKYLEYPWIYENAYRRKHEIPRSERTILTEIDQPGVDFFDFLTDETVNNPFSVISFGYNVFVNRIKYNRILSASHWPISRSTLNTFILLEETGFEFTDKEKEMILLMHEQENIEADEETLGYSQQEVYAFLDKYMGHVQSFTSGSATGVMPGIGEVAGYLSTHDVVLTDDEKELVDRVIVFENSEDGKKYMEIRSKTSGFIKQFSTENMEAVSKAHSDSRRMAREQQLESLFGIGAGLFTDIMNAQDVGRRIVSEMSPVSDDELVRVQENISTPFIREYIEASNRSMIARIEASRMNTGYRVHLTPEVEPEMLFDAIMKKYRGNVVYVDFWATWCGPCRSANSRIAPLKKEMVDEDVVFVYITNASSPEQTWKNMIPEIDGEHYRVTNEEWSVFQQRFQIRGVPHYVLVDKNGEVVNPKVALGMDNSALKQMLRNYIDK